MSEFKGTKGKWSQKFEGCEPSRVIRTDDGNKEVAQIYRYNSESEQKANALLISKAPEMLELMKELVCEFSDYKTKAQGTSKCDAIINAEKLIKEATEL